MFYTRPGIAYRYVTDLPPGEVALAHAARRSSPQLNAMVRIAAELFAGDTDQPARHGLQPAPDAGGIGDWAPSTPGVPGLPHQPAALVHPSGDPRTGPGVRPDTVREVPGGRSARR